MNTIGYMEESNELAEFSRRMNEICDDKGLPTHGRQVALGKLFEVSQKGARKWLMAESFPRWEQIIKITEWADVTIEWLMAGRGQKKPNQPYPTAAIAHVANMMQTMEPEKQYLVARLADQVAEPTKGATKSTSS